MPLTSRLGSQALACRAIRASSYWPQPSLKVTHMTMDGLLMCSSIIRFISRSYSARAAGSGSTPAVVAGMSCHTIRPSRSAQ